MSAMPTKRALNLSRFIKLWPKFSPNADDSRQNVPVPRRKLFFLLKFSCKLANVAQNPAKVQKRAAKAGFDWDEKLDVFKKLDEEVAELKEADKEGTKEQIFEEFGDLLFAAVNLSRFLNVNAEEALAFATDKFMRRFKAVEDCVLESNRDMKDLSLEELDEIWDKVKLSEKK